MLKTHAYRCYQFWKFREFTLLWTGIGTGCLEPLLFEILDAEIIQEIVLIGTAGAVNENLPLGSSYWLDRAYLGCTAILPISCEPAEPRWARPKPNVPSASIVSTDYYYGFSNIDSRRVRALQHADRRLVQALANFRNLAELVDMETAQFYHLCRVLGHPGLNFGALKGPANTISAVSEQTLHSETLLFRVVREARLLLASA